jgi:hypothetical protein
LRSNRAADSVTIAFARALGIGRLLLRRGGGDPFGDGPPSACR